MDARTGFSVLHSAPHSREQQKSKSAVAGRIDCRFVAGDDETPGFETLPKTLEEFEASVKRNFPQVSDWRRIESTMFDPNPDLGSFTNDIADVSVQYCGEFMVTRLVEETKKGGRVFAVVGASHVVKQERALKRLFN